MKSKTRVLEENITELEMALCHANGQLNAIQDACEQEIHKWEENEDRSDDNPLIKHIKRTADDEILKGRAEFAKQISDYLNEEE